MMKVAYILGSLNQGGAESLICDVLANRKMVGIDALCIHRKEGTLHDRLYSIGVSVYKINSGKGGVLGYIRSLRSVLKENKVQVAHTQMQLDCIYAWLATRGTGIKVVTTFHGFDYGCSRKTKRLKALAMKLADRVIFVSQAQRDYYVKEYGLERIGDKVKVVYNGVDFSKLKPKVKSQKSKEGVVRMCMVGSFVHGRDQMTMCKALKILHDKGLKFEFRFAGRCDQQEPWHYEECVRYCEENGLKEVQFMGNCSDVPGLLQETDVFAYATKHDTFGIAVVEAIAAGVPVVVNDYPTMVEVTENGRWAELYASGDAKACADRISAVVACLDEYKQKAQQYAEEIREKYTIVNHIKQLMTVYTELKQ